jgi:molecular chaperone GrpE
LNKELAKEQKDLQILEQEIEQLKTQNQLLEQKLQDISQHSKYLLADFENYKKQVSKQLETEIKCANKNLLLDLLNIFDDFERALPLIKNPEDLKGLTMIYKNLEKVFENYNVKRIDCLNKKFDPNYHEVLLQEESDKEENIILDELQKGYLYNDKVLRYSKVKLAKNISKEE